MNGFNDTKSMKFALVIHCNTTALLVQNGNSAKIQIRGFYQFYSIITKLSIHKCVVEIELDSPDKAIPFSLVSACSGRRKS